MFEEGEEDGRTIWRRRTVLGFWGLEEGSGMADGERKKKRKKKKKRAKEEDGVEELES